MDNISIILSWPDSFDFPVWRSNVSKLRTYTKEIIVCFTSHGSNPIKDWIRQVLPQCTFLDADTYQAQQYGGDWRNKSTNYMIDHASGEWILSLEPDFFIKDYEKFFTAVSEGMKTHNVITFEENQRFHPAFLLVKKDVVQKTHRNFSVMGQDKDHFWQFTKDIKGICDHKTLQSLELLEGRDWIHMRGLVDNYFAPKPYFDLPSFHVYNDACRELDVPVNEYWWKEMERCSKAERLNIQTSTLKEFL